MNDLISVVVTTYDREDALDAVLRSLSCQHDRHFEVIVADDGSSSGTAALVERWKAGLGVPLSHVWHEHRGFRAGAIRNRAVAASHGGSIVFLDGDCLARPSFIARHRALAERGWFVTGNRALLEPALTQTVLREGTRVEEWGAAAWFRARTNGGLNRLAPLLPLPLGPLRKQRPQDWQDARSCNLAVWRDDFERVDGFDEDFCGWGKEDSDLLVRLLHAGVSRKDGAFSTGVLHLWHPPADRGQLADNEARLQAVIDDPSKVRATRGLSCMSAA